MIEATAMTSADPVDMTAIKIRKSIAYSPVGPKSFCATNGAVNPADISLLVSIGEPCAELNPM